MDSLSYIRPTVSKSRLGWKLSMHFRVDRSILAPTKEM